MALMQCKVNAVLMASNIRQTLVAAGLYHKAFLLSSFRSSAVENISSHKLIFCKDITEIEECLPRNLCLDHF